MARLSSTLVVCLALAACSSSTTGGEEAAVDAAPLDGGSEDVLGPEDSGAGTADVDGVDAGLACVSQEDCDDGVECTGDVCTIEGRCEHSIAAGACLIDGQCFYDGAQHPDNECLQCEPSSSNSDWVGRPQGACDDGDPCTEQSYCDKDTCVGIPAESCCGDGVVEGAETCDGACPESCDDGEACTTDTLSGSSATCDALCVHEPIAVCVSGDLCCPGGCDANGDEDCLALCGNGAVEEGEACDGDCPTECAEEGACIAVSLEGSPETCDAECVSVEILSCSSDDGCCPTGCDANSDTDCPAVCGNGVIEPGEACDGGAEPDPALCTDSCTEPSGCEEVTDGMWVGDVFWPMVEESDPEVCLEVYFTHSQALTACVEKGPGWKLPSIAEANALLETLTPEEQGQWLPLIGNGGTQCQQMQQGLNGVWWLEEHDGASGGAAIFCNSGSCYTTGTQMGDSYLYRVRCVQTDCDSASGVDGCPALCGSQPEEPPPADGPPNVFAWTDNGTNTIASVDLTTGVKSTLASGLSWPLGIARDPSTQTLFWSSYTSQTIHRRVLPDGPIESFLTPGSNPAAMAFDPQAKHLYWTETVGKALRRSAPDGSWIETLATDLSFGIGLALDLENGKVYWSEETADVIRRANLDGSAPEDVVTSGLDQPRGITVSQGHVYWADRGTQTVRRRGVSGGSVEVLAGGFLFVQDVDVDPSTQTAYIIDDGISQLGSVYALNLATGELTELVKNLANPKHGLLWTE